jgi:hypothetical protein
MPSWDFPPFRMLLVRMGEQVSRLTHEATGTITEAALINA